MLIDAALGRQVRTRAANRCEYCHCHQDELPFVAFHVEHIVARQHGGDDLETNLCLSCHWCNFHKGTKPTTRVDGQLVPLFHPRLDERDEHFTVEGNKILGITAVGRGTVRLLDMNDDDRRELRRAATTA